MDVETLKCMCGHLFRNHFMLDVDDRGDRRERAVCGICGDRGDSWMHEFKLDNLSYLEKLYEEKTKE